MARRERFKFGLVAFSFFLILGFLVVSGLKKSWVYYFTVDELVKRATEMDGKKVKVSGVVVPGSIEERQKETIFEIEEKGERLKVFFDKTVPEAFGDSIPVIAEGIFNAQERTLLAHSLLTKCPSKYEAQVKPKAQK
jgi:cytochrome c-type biogenesis protein CcmE